MLATMLTLVYWTSVVLLTPVGTDENHVFFSLL